MAGARDAGARIVGKTNLHELAALPLGINPWFGTPANPLDPALVPGGSSSGSATAVATDEADVAYGSDTGGSVRIPAACCGIAGLKTTHGRISLDGVWPLAPSFDTIGPMARDIAGLVAGMRLLERGFDVDVSPAHSVGRIRTSGDPVIEAAVDAALRSAGFEVTTLEWDDLEQFADAWTSIYLHEIWDLNHELIEAHPEEVGADVAGIVSLGNGTRADGLREGLAAWRESFGRIFERVQLLALPTMPVFPPRTDAVSADNVLAHAIEMTANVTLFNAVGTPCTAQPVPAQGSRLPASLQLVGPRGGEALLLATAQVVEAAV